MSSVPVKLVLGLGTAIAAGYLLREKPIEVRGGVRRFSDKARKEALAALVGTSMDTANIPGQFAMRVTAFDPGGIPTMKMIQNSHNAGLNTFASDSILDLSSGSAGLVEVILIVADPSDGPLIAGPDTHFAELVAVHDR